MMCKNTCCFFGHRTINETEGLRTKLIEIIEKLIKDEKVDTFLFGSKSRFNSLCFEIVTEIKEKYPHIKRVYVRAEYPSDVFAGNVFAESVTEDPQACCGAVKPRPSAGELRNLVASPQ